MIKPYTTLIISSAFVFLTYCVNAQTATFTYTGAPQTWTVPAGVTGINVELIGANGGSGYGVVGSSQYNNVGGKGGKVVCALSVTPGQVLYIYVGSAGGNGTGGSWSSGGYNGGGSGSYSAAEGAAGAGGGATDIRFSTDLTDPVVIAGGGGGGGSGCTTTTPLDNGGNAGPYGESGHDCSGDVTSWIGGGGFSTAGGTAGSDPAIPAAGSPGGYCRGGSGCAGFGGGGGGEYGGGGAFTGGGGGGASYVNPTYASGAVYSAGYPFGDGQAIIKWFPAGIASITAPDNEASIFPNPAHETLCVKASNQAYRTCSVISEVGQVLIQQPTTPTETKISLADIPTGLYYVVLQGETRTVLTFVKE